MDKKLECIKINPIEELLKGIMIVRAGHSNLDFSMVKHYAWLFEEEHNRRRQLTLDFGDERNHKNSH